MTDSCGVIRQLAESERIRSFTCCGVSRAVCAWLGGADTIIPKRALVTKHHPTAPSLAGCIRVDDSQGDYTGRKAKSIRDLENCLGDAWRAVAEGERAEFLRWPDGPSEKTGGRWRECAN